MARAGRPSVYDKIINNLDNLKSALQNGYTIEQAAHSIGVGYDTLRKYANKYSEIRDVIKNSREKLLVDIENNLYLIALGKAKTTKTSYKYVYDEDGVEHIVEKNVVEDYIKPTTSDFVFILTNLSSTRKDGGIIWKNRQNDSDYLNELKKSLDSSETVFKKLNEALDNNKDNKGESNE